MQSCWLILFALLFPAQGPLATVSGQILDREGHPMAGALITYKNIGTIDRDIHLLPGMKSESPRMLEGTGRVYQIKTNKKGAFILSGIEYGVYQIEITGADGSHVYSGRKTVAGEGEPSAQNVLNVDLSTASRLPVEPGGGTNLAAGKKTKEQMELIRQENANAARINRLMGQYHAALEIQDWQSAIGLVQQLIALDAHRWEFYQNLGRLQANLMQYQDAAQSFAKGVEIAKKTLSNPSDTDRALTTIGDLLIAEADCYNRLDRVNDAAALYDEAAAVYPNPFMARFLACNALANRGRSNDAIEKCNQAIRDDPKQWGPYQKLGGVFTAANKPQEALAAYQNGIAAAQITLEEKPDSAPTKTGLGQMLISQGNLLVQMKQYDAAIAAFTRSASLAAYPALPYFNLCTVYYNLNRGEEAVAACERALSSDPTMADAYYIKGSILFGQGQGKNGAYVVPPGTIESLNNYLKYAPMGQHRATVKAMIDKLNEPIETPGKTVKK